MADKGLTYAEAGVDIDAGNRMVELIKPLRSCGSEASRRSRAIRRASPFRATSISPAEP
jgi:phosphoribosylaminoimidazole (AIR) synthetase